MVDINLKVPAIEKLIDYTASGIGAVVGPMLARWQAQTAANAARIGAQGQADVMRIKAQSQAEATILIASAQAEARSYFPIEGQSIQGEVNLNKEVESRLTFQEQKRQGNIGTVVRMAADELGDKQIEDHDVDHDWVARFFADVQDVTSEHMQRIWARILAGEIETPGRTSLHTLSILKNMTQRNAESFENLSRFVFLDAIFIKKEYTANLVEFPTYDTLVEMESYGLIAHPTGLVKVLDIELEKSVIVSGNTAYRICHQNTPNQLRIPAAPLSPQGQEIFNLVNPEVNENYLRAIARFMKENDNVKLERSKIIEKFSDGQIQTTPWVLVEPL